MIADFWSVAKHRISSTLGLIGVVSLPRYFVFHLKVHDPHPTPYIRVFLSCAIGGSLYLHSQWDEFADLWNVSTHASLDGGRRAVLAETRGRFWSSSKCSRTTVRRRFAGAHFARSCRSSSDAPAA